MAGGVEWGSGSGLGGVWGGRIMGGERGRGRGGRGRGWGGRGGKSITEWKRGKGGGGGGGVGEGVCRKEGEGEEEEGLNRVSRLLVRIHSRGKLVPKTMSTR